MPRPITKTRPLISLDTETTGLDLFLGALPYFVTTCDEQGQIRFWEWEVDPLTRRPRVPPKDLDEVLELVERSELVLQNAKFDAQMLNRLDRRFGDQWPWDRTHDTLTSGHLLSSNQPHDLTSMALVYCGVNIQPLEDALEEATKASTKVVKSRSFVERHGEWSLAKVGRPDMPSVRKKSWKLDGWVPRQSILEAARTLDLDLIPADPRMPTVGRTGRCSVRIDRGTKWGNPFVEGRDGGREQVVRMYAQWITGTRKDRTGKTGEHLLADLPELYGQVLGCHCRPDRLCHGDVLRVLCSPWFTVLADYSNGDSSSTIGVFLEHRRLIQEKGLVAMYEECRRVNRVVYLMEQRGMTMSRPRLESLSSEYRGDSDRLGAECLKIAEGYGYRLEMPNGAKNDSLVRFVFGWDGTCSKCDSTGQVKKRSGPVECPKCLGQAGAPRKYLGLSSPFFTDTGAPSFNREALEYWQHTLDEGPAKEFIDALTLKRRRDADLNAMAGYARYWVPVDPTVADCEWYSLHPHLNATGTNTLRGSSDNPNEQSISNKTDDEGRSVRYVFGPTPGREWWSLDAKNVELRIPAYESGEPELIELFEEPDKPPYYGSNHLLNFSTIYRELWEKALAKVGLDEVGPYCKKEYKSTQYKYCKLGAFSMQYGSVDREDGTGTADRAFRRPGAQAMLRSRFVRQEALSQRWVQFAERHGYVETMPDRTVDPRRGYPLWCRRTRHGRIKPTIPFSYHVQSTAMWVMRRMMVVAQDYLNELNAKAGRPDHFLICQIHDEMVLDLPFRPRRPNGRPGNLDLVLELKRRLDLVGNDLIPRVPIPMGVGYHPRVWSDEEVWA